MYRLDKTGNCVFSLCYHLIMVVKYRRKVFDEYINNLLECVEDIIRCPASTNDCINMFLKLKDDIK